MKKDYKILFDLEEEVEKGKKIFINAKINPPAFPRWCERLARTPNNYKFTSISKIS